MISLYITLKILFHVHITCFVKKCAKIFINSNFDSFIDVLRYKIG